MKKLVVSAAVAAALSGFARVRSLDAMSDDEYKEFLVNMTAPCCGNGGGGLSSISPLPDTNRFLRLVKEVAHSNTNRTGCMIVLVAEYGREDDLPFLYEYVDDEILGDVALHGIFKIDGINTNTLMAVRQYLSLPEQGRGRCDEDVCGELLRYAMQPQTTEEARQMAKDCIHDFALVDTNGVKWLDRIINYQLSDYRYSTNRLEVMRSVLAHGPKANQYDYVTNAIHEIEAHLPPE
ncbi:MAG: hypothetical protein IJ173_09815 [Kiritimatiellae bacterium]|nr:hypothetical protein [Kiritimatiellia bacterium]